MGVLVAAGKAAWQMAKAAYDCMGSRIDAGVVATKYDHVMGPICTNVNDVAVALLNG